MDDIRSACFRYYITSGGRIWGVRAEEILENEAGKRRELIGNGFETLAEAATARAKLGAFARVRDYARVSLDEERTRLVLDFEFPEGEVGRRFLNDLRVLADGNNVKKKIVKETFLDEEKWEGVPHYVNAKEARAAARPERFLEAIKARREEIADAEQRRAYDNFIREHETPRRFNVPFFTPGAEKLVWADGAGEWHSGYFCCAIDIEEIGELDPELLILYAPHFIRRFEFPEWYNCCLRFGRLEETREYAEEIGLNALEKEILGSGEALKKGNWEELDEDYWWAGGKCYDIDQEGRMAVVE